MPINSFLYPGAKVTTGYDVANSCRFDDGSSSYLHKTPSSGGNRRTFTFSTWFKRGTGFGNEQAIFTGGNDANAQGFFTIYFTTNDRIDAHFWNGSSFDSVTPNGVLRDSSAWTHIVVGVDTTQSTAANRIKWYINGTEQTSLYSTDYPDQNHEFNVNHTAIMQVGVRRNGSAALAGYYDGYLAETVLIDGTQLDATSFGEFDSDSPNIWKPIDVSGLTFGTNGFYLDFEDSSNLGNDVNGGTDLTAVNLAATDQSTDTCTNNFATLNPLFATQDSGTMSEGNTIYTASANAWGGSGSTIGLSQGKWYFEAQINDNAGGHFFGVIDETANVNDNPHQRTGSTFYYSGSGGQMYKDGSGSGSYGTFGASDIAGVALNLDDDEITIYKNGSAIVTDFALSTTKNTLFVWVMGYNSGSDLVKVNFGGTPPFSISSSNSDANGYGNFEYSVPSGYYSINTKNLAEFG